MSVQRTTSRSGGRQQQSLFFRDIASPISSHRGKFVTPRQAAAVSALWKENFSVPDLPPPPVFTLEDRADFSPELGIGELPASPEFKSEGRTPATPSPSPRPFATPFKGKGEVAGSDGGSSGGGVGGGFVLAQQHQMQQTPGSANWWSSVKGGGGSGEHNEKGKGSPADGVIQPGALVVLPPPREVVRPELQRNNFPAGSLDEEEWVTVYGFPPGDTNLVLREFEKCGVILKHIPGPRDANWMHILYQNQYDAQKALRKNGMQINSVLIVGVKPVDPMQRQYLNDKPDSNGRGFFMVSSCPPLLTNGSTTAASSSKPPMKPQNQFSTNGISDSRRRMDGVIATPAKSVFSKAMDLMFGL